MSNENNICEICGGVKRIEYTIGFVEGAPHDMRVEPHELPVAWRMCFGHPEPAQKHDGDLGHNASVWIEDEQHITADGETFYTKYVKISDKVRCVGLIPKEALSLLAWLKQEEAELRRLSEET